jgi:predicted nucleotidyltransferase
MQPSSVQSFARFPLTQLLASGGHVRVLRALLSHGGAQSAAQLASDCAMTARGVRNTLDALVAQGAVKVMGPAGARLFAPALDRPLVSALAQLFESERQHWQWLQEQLRAGLAAEKEIRSAWLYGSVARGTDEPRSDMDVALVLARDSVDASRQVRDAVQVLGERLGVHISPVVLAPTDLARLTPSDPWWSEVRRDAKVLKGIVPDKEAARCAKAAQPA